MYFWREGYFLTLKDTAAAAASTSANWLDYANFCLEYERGLRRQAFLILERFIFRMEREPFAERRCFVGWLMLAANEREGRHMIVPHPLQIRIVEPTLLEWVEVEPYCSEPHRWLGGYEHLEKAIELDPADDIARKKFIVCLLSQVGFATHELPTGYLGSPSSDLATLKRVEALLPGLLIDSDRIAYAAVIAEERAAIREYLRKS